jgi:hypothetical protein
MKKPFVMLIAVASALLVLGAGQALGSARHSGTTKTVTVVMHDPGCHWFAVGKKFLTKLTVKGPIALQNFDEATLKVTGANGTKLDRVGKKISLAPGTYRITMVGQAPDDNTLKLVVK